ncbi:TetR/AcrR family transcriptional regulator [Glaciibacter superstes]|uniref:TetR/AcrR family transcriptional regulator n=1 Tax=Glaciibacter superstes TaxID=501023 RepID=UPI0003B3C3DC|nr:TetR/AcrR family transcriptional regulator [Glaciibacter superstes]
MSHRDNLLVAARSCLLSRGYAATTVRDLVEESGANQASINYHFGSKDRLLNQALFDLNREWGMLLFEALGVDPTQQVASCGPPDGSGVIELWVRVIESIRSNEQLWFVNFESISFVQHDPEIRQMNADGQAASRDALALAFAGLGNDSDPAARRAVGSHYYSLLVGLALQLLTDPDSAPTAAEVFETDSGIRTGRTWWR